MSKPKNLAVIVAAAVLVSSAAVAFSQGMAGSVQGVVTDEATGDPLPETSITLFDPAVGRTFATKTDKKGRFYKRGVLGGRYHATIEKESYKKLLENLTVAGGKEHRFNFKLAKAAPEGAREFAEGFAAFNTGDNEAAAAFFEAAMEKAPDMPEIRVNLALAYLRLDRKAEAVAKLQEAVKMAPEEPRTLFQLGGAYVEMNDFDKAQVAFEEGLAKNSDLSDPLALEATITLGAVYFAKGDSDQSIIYFEKALGAQPGNVVPLLGLAKAYLSKGDENAKALELFEQVLVSSPGTPEAAQAQAFVDSLKKMEPAPETPVESPTEPTTEPAAQP